MPFAARVAAALLSGALLMLVSPPANLYGLHWVLYLPLFWALRPGENRRNALLGYMAGWLGVFLLFFWLIETVVRFSSLPWVVALLVHVLFATAFALPYAVTFGLVHWFRRRIGAWWVLAIPLVHVALEKLSPALFPYYQGVTQYRAPAIWQLASVTGVMGLTFLIMLTNAALAEGLYRWREGRRQPVAIYGVVAALFLANLGFGAWRHARVEAVLTEAPTIDAAILQQDVTMEERMSQSAVEGLRAWLDLTEKVTDLRPDLVVWPEGAVAFNPNGEAKARVLGDRSPREFIEEMTRAGGYDFLVGGGTLERHEPDAYGRRYTAFNSSYVFTDEQGLVDRYDKMVPLPFGEYIPFSDTFPVLKSIIQGPGDFQAGSRPTAFQARADQGVDYVFSVPICYEAILESAMWELYEARDPQGPHRGPVDLFVNITNDAWFGDTASPHQHAMLTTVQAIQFGRPLLRLAYTGISWVVEPHGDIAYETTPFTEVVDTVPVRLGAVRTVYTRGGWLFPWACLAGALAMGGVAWRRGRAREGAEAKNEAAAVTPEGPSS